MTREERELSITYLEGIKEKYIEGEGYERHPLPEYYAIEMAIKALEQEPIDYKAQYEKFTKKAEIVISQLRADRDRLMSLTSATPQEPILDKIRAEGENFVKPRTGEWIPVTERLPEEGTFVLASYNSDEGVDVVMTYYNKYGFTRGLMTAWMPLPEPYKEEE